jgi:hypothetical protein
LSASKVVISIGLGVRKNKNASQCEALNGLM